MNSLIEKKLANDLDSTVQKYKKTSKSKSIKAKRTAKIRRQRGYNWEDTLVKRFNTVKNWKAFRLGSPSVALPDILAVNSKSSSLFTLEAKSGTGTTLQVPFDQISRCLRWTDTFELYETRKVILAIKFLSKKRIGVGQYESRELREFYKVWNPTYEIMDCVCTYDGKTYGIKEGKQVTLNLEEFQMPFKTKHRIVI